MQKNCSCHRTTPASPPAATLGRPSGVPSAHPPGGKHKCQLWARESGPAKRGQRCGETGAGQGRQARGSVSVADSPVLSLFQQPLDSSLLESHFPKHVLQPPPLSLARNFLARRRQRGVGWGWGAGWGGTRGLGCGAPLSSLARPWPRAPTPSPAHVAAARLLFMSELLWWKWSRLHMPGPCDPKQPA